MKKSKRNKAQKRQQALQRRRQQHVSTRRPVTQIPPESADQVAMTTTGEILQLIRLHYEVEDSDKLRALFASLRCLEYDASQTRWVWLYTEEARTLSFKNSACCRQRGLRRICLQRADGSRAQPPLL